MDPVQGYVSIHFKAFIVTAFENTMTFESHHPVGNQTHPDMCLTCKQCEQINKQKVGKRLI